MKKIYVNEEFCIGCRLCEIHCIVQHSKSKKILKAFKDENAKACAAVTVQEEGCLSFALQCRHCADAPCIEACMTGAMERDPKTGAVLHDEERCVGCWMCVMVCPFGVTRPDHEKHKIGSKCDLCRGKDTPACVEHCPNEALTYEDKDEKSSGK
jgi:anaerobic carbon-monoxide dehydrogenase iron sulfur subunit